MPALPCNGRCMLRTAFTSNSRHTRHALYLHTSTQFPRQHPFSRQRNYTNNPSSRAQLVCSAKQDINWVRQKQQTEKSVMAESELVYFMFQLNLDTQLQRMLNMDDFDTAQEIRKRRKQIDEIVAEQLEAKGPGCGTRSANQTAVADVASEGLRLRSELQRAIDEERYADAAEMRDRLKVVQAQSEQAQSEAAGADRPVQQYQLGQRVKHAKLGYDGVVCGWDNCCCEGEQWQKAANVADLQKGSEQHFYHLLVDAKHWEASWDRPPVAYVAEELLDAPEDPETWPEVYGYDSFDHAYLYTLFLGQDARGNMLPVRQLRDRYSQQRQDVYPKEDAPDENGGDDDADESSDKSSAD